MENKKDKKRPVVYFDGDCPMCRAFVPLIDEPEKEDSVKFENLRDSTLPQGINYSDATEKIHVVTEDGEILKGAKAVFKALETNNKYLWLVRFGRLPIVSNLAEIIYALIAKNRFLLFDPDKRNSRLLMLISTVGILIFILGFLLWKL